MFDTSRSSCLANYSRELLTLELKIKLVSNQFPTSYAPHQMSSQLFGSGTENLTSLIAQDSLKKWKSFLHKTTMERPRLTIWSRGTQASFWKIMNTWLFNNGIKAFVWGSVNELSLTVKWVFCLPNLYAQDISGIQVYSPRLTEANTRFTDRKIKTCLKRSLIGYLLLKWMHSVEWCWNWISL